MLMKVNIEIVPTRGANIHVLVFTHTYNNLFSTRFIHLIHTFDFVAKLNMHNSRHGIGVVQMGNLMNKKTTYAKREAQRLERKTTREAA
jgi:hypothetical protein